MTDLDGKLTQKEFGELVGISQPAVSDLQLRGVLAEDASGATWLLAYCAHLREVAAGRLGEGPLVLADERARLAKEQADKVALQNAVTRGELAPVILIEQVLSRAAGRIAGLLDAIPGAIKRRIPALPSAEVELIVGEVAKCRNIVGCLSLSDLSDDDAGEDKESDDETIDG